MDSPQVSPHSFDPLNWWDAWMTLNGRCRHCLRPRHEHPVGWVEARSIGDQRYPEITGNSE